VTSTPWAPPISFFRYRIGLLSIDGYRRAKALGQGELPVIDIDRGDVEAYLPGVLHRHMAEATDAGDHHPPPIVDPASAASAGSIGLDMPHSLPRLLARRSRRLGDQARAALAGEIRPEPLALHAQAVLQLRQG